MTYLRAIVAEVRKRETLGAESDAEIARVVGDVCAELLRQRGRSSQLEWFDEVVARTVATFRNRVRVQ